MADPLRLFLIRHGETVGPKGVLYSQQDVPLSPRGLWQSKKLVSALEEVPLAAVFASDLTRAATPARWLAERKGIPLFLRPELREINFGAWTGKTFAELLKLPDFRQRLAEPAAIAPPGGETLFELQQRALKAIEEIRARFPEKIVAVFTHGGLIRALLLHVLGASLNNFFKLQQDHAAVNLIDFYPEGPVVRLVNGPFELNFNMLLARDAFP